MRARRASPFPQATPPPPPPPHTSPPRGAPRLGPGARRSPRPQPGPAAGDPGRRLSPAPLRRAVAELPPPGCRRGGTKPRRAGGSSGRGGERPGGPAPAFVRARCPAPRRGSARGAPPGPGESRQPRRCPPPGRSGGRPGGPAPPAEALPGRPAGP